MKIMFVSSGKAGGVGHVVRNQGESLKKAGIEVDYFLIHPGLAGYIRDIPRLRRAAAGREYDIVHAHYSLSGFVAMFAGCQALIVSLMGSDIFMSGLLRILIRFLHGRRWNATIVKTREMAETLGIKEALVIPNGVDLSRFKPLPMAEAREYLGYPADKKIVILISITDKPVKNIELASEAVRHLNDPEIDFRIVRGVPNEEIPYYLNAADVMILTSKWEGSANVIKEAMACNCPIVSTDVGDVKWVTDALEGCYISSFKPSALAKNLNKALVFGTRTSGRERIIRLGLDSESITLRVKELYEKIQNNQDRDTKVLYDESIPADAWQSIGLLNIHSSPFQTREFYNICNSIPGLVAQAYAVLEKGAVTALAVVVIQRERGLRGWFARRATVFGGPLTGQHDTGALESLLSEITSKVGHNVIYIETRNFTDYSEHHEIFIQAGWQFVPYLNVTVNTENRSLNDLMAGMNYNRRRQIRSSIEKGAIYRECETEDEFQALYNILNDLYKERVRRPLPDPLFFRALWQNKPGKVFLVLHEGKIIGGSFCLVQPRKSIYTMYYCGQRNYDRRIFPTHLAVLAAMDYAVQNNLKSLDFMGAGRRDKEYGVRTYKLEFGGELNEYGRYIRIQNPILFAIGKLGLRIMNSGIRAIFI